MSIRLFLKAAAVFAGLCLALPAPANATTVTLTATQQGWYDSTGSHDSTNQNYIAGFSSMSRGITFRNFFVFDLSGVNGTIGSAALRLDTANYSSPDPTETYSLYDVSTAIGTLIADQNNATGIFGDLGSGTGYGDRSYSAADDFQVRDVALNAAGLLGVTGALGGDFALGGVLTTLSGQTANDEFLFGTSESFVAQLVLDVTETGPSAVVREELSAALI